MEVEKQKDDGQSGGSSNRPQSSDVEIKWDFGSFIPLGLRTATPMSEGGGEAFKWTVGPYGDRLIGGGTRSQIYGDMRYGSGYPGRVEVSVSGAPFPFGFYPLYMPGPNMKSTEEFAPVTMGFWRPGGDTGAQFVTSKPLGPTAARFYLIGDSSSVSVAQVALMANCSATSLDEPFTALVYPITDGTNTTHYPKTTEIIQFYRASSFALSLSGFNASELPEGTVSAVVALPDSVDRSFLECINRTIASTIPIMDASEKHATSPAVAQASKCGAVIGVLLVCLALTYWRLIKDFCLRHGRRIVSLGRWIKARLACRTVETTWSWSRSWWWLRPKIRLLLILAVAALLVVITVTSGLRILARDNSVTTIKAESMIASASGSGIFLESTIGEWDMDARTLSFRFAPVLCNTAGEMCTQSLNEDLFFFKNSDALGDGGFNKSNAILEFKSKWQPIAIAQAMDLEARQYQVGGGNGELETDVKYPWDWYGVSLLIAATRADLNTTVPILGVRLRNAMQTEWKFSMSYRHVQFDSQAAKVTVAIYVDRTYATVVTAILILVLNWIVTLGILWMTVSYRRRSYRSLEGLESVALPFAALFAMPTMRSVMPGQPPLGCFIDFAGIIPNLAICSVCATFHLMSRIYTEVKRKSGAV